MIGTYPVKEYSKKLFNQGFTYTLVLVSIVIMGILSNVTTALSSRISQTEKEKELLFRGLAYMKAIESYYNVQGKHHEYPKSLDDLVNDPRFANKHHLRRKYSQIFQNNLDWNLIQNEHGRIIGVVSTEQVLPLKQANFPPQLEKFEKKNKYSQWRFIYQIKHVKNKSNFQQTLNKKYINNYR